MSYGIAHIRRLADQGLADSLMCREVLAALEASERERERLREGLIRLVYGDYDSGWNAESYADALLDGGDLADEPWTIYDAYGAAAALSEHPARPEEDTP